MQKIKRICVLLSALTAVMLASPSALGQGFPNRPITMVVGFGAGGPTDLFARLLAQGMKDSLGGQNLIVENKPGASGGIAVQATMDAKPDGYFLNVMTTGIVSLPLTLKAYANYDPVKSLTPISYLVYSPLIIMAPSDSPAKNLKEFIDHAKASPGKFNYGSQGGSADLDLGLFMSMAGLKLEIIRYKGSAPTIQALASGEVQFAIDAPGSSKSFIDSGKVKVIGLLTDKPWPVMPNLPMAKDLLPGYVGVPGWWGLNGPKGMPQDVVDKLSSASRAAVNKPEIKSKLADLGIYVDDGGPQELDRRTAQAIETWRKGAQITGLQPQ